MSNNVLATLKENTKQADETIALLKKHLAILEKETSKFSWYDLFLDYFKKTSTLSHHTICFVSFRWK